jgi:hypothetical protein
MAIPVAIPVATMAMLGAEACPLLTVFVAIDSESKCRGSRLVDEALSPEWACFVS